MPPRAISSGTIAFGLVSIPIKLFTSSNSSSGISFRMLHDKCHSKLKQQYLCTNDGEVVTRDHVVKGYEFAKDRYVVFQPEEIKAVEEESTRSIDIAEFVPIETIDPVYFDKAYYLGPDKGGDRAYRLLAEVMRQTGLAGLAKYAARGKQYLVMVRPMQDGLVMQQLKYADEVRSFADIPTGEGEVKPAELALAKQLVEQITSDSFRPEKYEDEVRARLHEIIQQKVEGQEVTIAPAEEPKAQIIDLMEALKASLGEAPAKKPAKAASSGGSDGGKKAARKPARKAARKVSRKKKKAAGSK